MYFSMVMYHILVTVAWLDLAWPGFFLLCGSLSLGTCLSDCLVVCRRDVGEPGPDWSWEEQGDGGHVCTVLRL